MKRLLLSWTLWERYLSISFFKIIVALWVINLLVIFIYSSNIVDFFQSRFYLGDVGNGAAMKLVVNMIMGRLFKV